MDDLLSDRSVSRSTQYLSRLQESVTNTILSVDDRMEKLLGWSFIGKELMTGLPEYRNGELVPFFYTSEFMMTDSISRSFLGGLLIDFNLLQPKFPSLLESFSLPVPSTPSEYPSLLEVPPLDPSHSAVVEMRAVTIIMLDRLAQGIRKKLGVELTLPQVLEAGTWKAVSLCLVLDSDQSPVD